jgi:hypothetical protein
MSHGADVEFDLGPGQAEELGSGGDLVGLAVQCLSGMVWLSEEGVGRDHVLTTGRERRIERPGRVVVRAIKASRVRVRERPEGARPPAA